MGNTILFISPRISTSAVTLRSAPPSAAYFAAVALFDGRTISSERTCVAWRSGSPSRGRPSRLRTSESMLDFLRTTKNTSRADRPSKKRKSRYALSATRMSPSPCCAVQAAARVESWCAAPSTMANDGRRPESSIVMCNFAAALRRPCLARSKQLSVSCIVLESRRDIPCLLILAR